MIDYLSKTNLKFFTFIDRYTFSSGIMALEDMLKLGTVVIGEEAGSTLNHFGNIEQTYFLPNTKFQLRISSRYFRFNKDAATNKNYFKENITCDDLKPMHCIPDILVKPCLDDYKNNIDSYMEKFNMIISNKENSENKLKL